MAFEVMEAHIVLNNVFVDNQKNIFKSLFWDEDILPPVFKRLREVSKDLSDPEDGIPYRVLVAVEMPFSVGLTCVDHEAYTWKATPVVSAVLERRGTTTILVTAYPGTADA